MPIRAGGRAVGVTAVGALLVLATACSRGGDDPTVDGEPRTTGVSEPGTSTTRATTTTIAACPPVERYLGDEDVEDQGDLDGDERADFVQSFPTSPDSTTVTLLVDLAAGGGAHADIPSEHLAPTTLLGAEVLDARADGRDVLWVRVGAGASTTILGLYHLDGCSLEAATFENGDPVELPIGGTVGNASGARCGSLDDPDADLLAFEATNLSGREYEVVTTEYLWQDGRLLRSQKGAPKVTRTDDLTDVSGFRCGDLSL